MRTGVLGGTFNPVHMGHVLLADAAARELRLDRTLLIPAGIPPHKQVPELAADRHRLAMCKLAAAQIRGGQVSDLELRRGGKSYTCRTLEMLKEQYPADTLYLICGGDMFLTLQDWKRPETIFQLADTHANILILGENGTGKDVVARLVKHCSPRRHEALITIDLGSIPEQLFESELFGYEKGAFTDARTAKPGRMEMASGGTLFLDEIGNLSLPMQAKLLTALEKRCITRLGAVESRDIDIRLICATNANLTALAAEGSFRQDLLYRINTIELHIPPLRERGDDIILLAEHFLKGYNRKYKKNITGLSREARNKLLRYAWPGNVRELQHVLERAAILSPNQVLRPEDLALPSDRKETPAETDIEELNLERLERRAIEKALRLAGGNLTLAAEMLGITRFALYRKMSRLNL